MAPRIPEDQPPKYSTQLPGVTFPMHQEFGKVGQAAQNLGGDVENAAVTANNIYNEVQRQNAISTSETAAVNDKLASEDYIRQQKLNSPDGLIHDPSTASADNPAGVVVFNEDGVTPRTIDQDYNDWAKKRFEDNQANMTPMAAGMYSQRALGDFKANVAVLKNDSQAMQLNASDQAHQKNNEAIMSRYNTTAFGTAQDPNVPDVRGLSQDILQQNTALSKTAPVYKDGQLVGGLRGPEQIAALQTKQSSEFANHFMASTLMKWNSDENSSGSPIATARLNAMKAQVKGEDPTSQDLNSRGLPTLANSLSASEQTDWLNKLDSYGTTATKIDRSAFDLALENFQAGAKLNLDGYRAGQASPALTNLMHGSEALGYTDADKIHKIWAPIVTAQTLGGMGGAAFDGASASTQHNLAAKAVSKNMATLNALAQSSGTLYPANMALTLEHEVSGQVQAEIEKQQAEKKSDLAGFLSKPASGPQPTTGPVQMRNPTMYLLSQQDASNIPSLTSSGLLPKVLDTMDRATKVNFGGITPTYMPANTYQQMAGAFTNPHNSPENQQAFLDDLRKPTSKGGAGDRFGLLLHQMVTVGGLDPRYEDVAKIPTIQGQVAAIGAIQSGGMYTKMLSETPNGEKPEAVQALAQKQLAPYLQNSLLAAFDNNSWTKQANLLKQAWSDEYAKVRLANPGMSSDDAQKSATQSVLSKQNTFESISQSRFDLGPLGKWGQVGAKTQVSLSPNYSDTQKATIKQNLLDAQSAAHLGSANIVLPPPAQGEPDFRDKATPEWVNAHAAIWVPEQTSKGIAYSLKIQGTNPDNTLNGRPQYLMRKLPDGTLSKYTVSEKDALTPRVPQTQMGPPVPVYKGGKK